MKLFLPLSLALVFAVMSLHEALGEENEKLRAGIIGLDTSHVTAFTGIINRESTDGPLADVHVVAAFPAGSPDLEVSSSRIEGFTNKLRGVFGVEIVDSIEALLGKVDVVLLESVDGRPHLAQARPVIQAGKPLFIDKPIAASLADTIAIFELAEKHNVPVFSSSALRFGPSLQHLVKTAKFGRIERVDAYGPINPLKGHPDLFFYGIHGVEMLFTVMGGGCEEVTWQENNTVKGVWSDGRIGTFNPSKGYKVVVLGTEGTMESSGFEGYTPLIDAMCTFFKTGQPPVSPAETINLVAFMTAAQVSKDKGNATVQVDDVMKAAREEIEERD